MNNQLKSLLRWLIWGFIIIYVVSPIDLMSMCPLDDIAVAALGGIIQKKLNEQSAA